MKITAQVVKSERQLLEVFKFGNLLGNFTKKTNNWWIYARSLFISLCQWHSICEVTDPCFEGQIPWPWSYTSVLCFDFIMNIILITQNKLIWKMINVRLCLLIRLIQCVIYFEESASSSMLKPWGAWPEGREQGATFRILGHCLPICTLLWKHLQIQPQR